MTEEQKTKPISCFDIVYISGQMSGLPDYNYAAFNEAEHFLVNTYHCTVINPARHPICENLTWDYYMQLAEVDVKHCDVIVLIEGEMRYKGKTIAHSWKNSKGALMEIQWAMSFEKRIIKMKELEAKA